MTHYYDNGNFEEVFPEMKNLDVFGEVLSKAGLKQLRCAETEKFAHVTFFFNDQNNDKYPGEDHVLVSSPKVATYDLQPEMSAAGVANAAVQAVESGQYDFIIVNFANPDMVGHTGVLAAAIAGAATIFAAILQLRASFARDLVARGSGVPTKRKSRFPLILSVPYWSQRLAVDFPCRVG